MPKIRNAGTATMRFGEGIIVSGSSGSTYAIHASGSVEAEELFLDKDSEPAVNFSIGGAARAKISVNSSNNLVLHNQFINKHIVLKVNDQGVTREGIRLNGAVPEVVINEQHGVGGDQSLIDFRVESQNSTHMLFVSGGSDSVLFGADSSNSEDTNFFVSGSTRSRGTSTRGTAVFSGDLVVSGTLTAVQKHICTAKYTADNQKKLFIRFNAAGSNEIAGVNNKFVTPCQGNLSFIMIRSTGTPGQTTIGFHRATDGTEDIDEIPEDTQNIVMSSANIVHKVMFAHAANFGPGDIVGLSVDPAANHGNVDITLVFELDFVL